MYDSGLGVEPLNTLPSALNMPRVTPSLMKRYERHVGPAFQSVAQSSCKKYIDLEKKLTEEAAM